MSAEVGRGPRGRRPRARYRAVFVSDVHLGSRSCHAQRLRRFLKSVHCERLYLVGDVVDLWALRRRWYWPQAHVNVIRTVLKKAQQGCDVVYIPGNHDETFRDFAGLSFGGVRIEREALHVTADGRRLLVVHGDEFDALVSFGWLQALGDVAYEVTLVVNRWVNALRRMQGLPEWSLAAFVKRRVRNAVEYVARFREALARRAKAAGADGVVCGHIHRADACAVDGVAYYNDGDWVESCTALVEHPDGRLEVLAVREEAPGALSDPGPGAPRRALAGGLRAPAAERPRA